MGGALVFVVIALLVIATVELPPLWGKPDRRGERLAVVGLLAVGGLVQTAVALGYQSISLWPLIRAAFEPVGTLLFKLGGG